VALKKFGGGHMTVPVVSGTQRSPGAAGTPEDGRRQGILLVDDAAVVRTVLAELLMKRGYAAWTAAEGSQAIDLYREHRHEIDLVVLDRCMPGLDGAQTLDALRAINPSVRSCFLTGESSTDVGDLLNRGVELVLFKPMEPEQVVRELEAMLARP
jgi:CheY-like chemotaxis protein